MQSKSEMASGLFIPGFNCAQSVLAPFCEKYGLDMETALKMSTGLGGGCNLGELCGAVIGASMVIGLKDGRYLADDMEARRNCMINTAKFIDEFRAEYGSAICRDLLGYDLSTEEGKARKKTEVRADSPCVDYVKNSVVILEKMGY